MNSRNRTFYSLSTMLLAALPAMLFVAGCGVVRERRTTHIANRWPAGTIRHIEVREIDGEINVEAGSDSEIAMDATVRSRVAPRPSQDNQGYFRTEIAGDTLIIGRRNEHHFSFFSFGNETRVDYDLRVPASIALDLRTVNGRIATHGVDGEMRAVTVNGRVNIDTPGSSEVEAHTVNGRIEARFVKSFQGATLKTVNGGVTAILPLTASFTGDFSQVNGDIEAAFPLNIHSHPGSRRVSGEVNGGRYDLHITTVNGDIKIDTAPAAPPAPPAPAATPTASAPPIT
jgi:Putative adhesin